MRFSLFVLRSRKPSDTVVVGACLEFPAFDPTGRLSAIFIRKPRLRWAAIRCLYACWAASLAGTTSVCACWVVSLASFGPVGVAGGNSGSSV